MPKVYATVPVLNESENIPYLIEDFRVQDFPESVLVVCVNQPEEWWDNPGKAEMCRDNARTLAYLHSLTGIEIVVIDRSSRGKGWIGKKHGVGWARKTAMDEASRMANDSDIIVSMDADTRYPSEYFSAVVRQLDKYPAATGLSVPYYHKLTGEEEADRCILRYELYMRNYALNMMRINNPYAFSAIGSGMACSASGYRRVGGLSPKMSGEDFYFIQKLRKAGPVIVDCDAVIYPAARFSDRVYFGTGPAMIRGRSGNWDSYPVYPAEAFNRVKETYDLFEKLSASDVETPMDAFIRSIQDGKPFWEPLRKNSPALSAFKKACIQRLDGLRILQYLKTVNGLFPGSNEERINGLLAGLLTDGRISETPGLTASFRNIPVHQLDALRNVLFEAERSMQKEKQMV